MPSKKVEIQYGSARKHLPLKGGKLLDESIITSQEPIYPKNKGLFCATFTRKPKHTTINENRGIFIFLKKHYKSVEKLTRNSIMRWKFMC